LSYRPRGGGRSSARRAYARASIPSAVCALSAVGKSAGIFGHVHAAFSFRSVGLARSPALLSGGALTR